MMQLSGEGFESYDKIVQLKMPKDLFKTRKPPNWAEKLPVAQEKNLNWNQAKKSVPRKTTWMNRKQRKEKN